MNDFSNADSRHNVCTDKLLGLENCPIFVQVVRKERHEEKTLDDSAFFQAQRYITEIYCFAYLTKLAFWMAKNHFSPQFRSI